MLEWLFPGEGPLSRGVLLEISAAAEAVGGSNRGLKRAIWLGYSARDNVDAILPVRSDFKVEGSSDSLDSR